MNIKELVKETAVRSEYSQAVCEEIVRAMWDVVKDELAGHGDVTVARFGKFSVKDVEAKIQRLPTGEMIESPAHGIVKFSPSARLKEVVR